MQAVTPVAASIVSIIIQVVRVMEMVRLIEREGVICVDSEEHEQCCPFCQQWVRLSWLIKVLKDSHTHTNTAVHACTHTIWNRDEARRVPPMTIKDTPPPSRHDYPVTIGLWGRTANEQKHHLFTPDTPSLSLTHIHPSPSSYYHTEYDTYCHRIQSIEGHHMLRSSPLLPSPSSTLMRMEHQLMKKHWCWIHSNSAVSNM